MAHADKGTMAGDTMRSDTQRIPGVHPVACMTEKADPAADAPLVVRVDARQCEVLVDGEIRPARMRGRLFKNQGIDKVPVAVGDRVELSGRDPDLAIDAILPRRNIFARRASGDDANRRQLLATNVDQVVVVNSVGIPPFSSIVADRILATCAFAGIPAVLVLNKIDKAKRRRLEKIRASYEHSEAPVLLTSATEHLGMDEFLARVGALLRRRGKSQVAQVEESGYRDSVVTIDLDRHEVWVRGEQIEFTPTEFRLLCFLTEKVAKTCGLREILSRVWESPHYPFEVVKWHIARLRSKVEEDPRNPKLIVTVRGVGYRYDPPSSQNASPSG